MYKFHIRQTENESKIHQTLVCDHSNETYWAVLSCGTVYFAVQGGSEFEVYQKEPIMSDHSDESYWEDLFNLWLRCTVQS